MTALSAGELAYNLRRDGDMERLALGLGCVFELLVTSACWSVGITPGGGGATPNDSGPAETNVTTLATGRYLPQYLAVDEASVYWMDLDGTVAKVPVGGGDVETLATDGGEPWGLAVDSVNVYWTSGTDVFRVLLTGGPTETVASTLSFPTSIVASNGVVFGTDYFADTVFRVDSTGGSAIAVASDQPGPSSLALEGSTLYWVDTCNDLQCKPQSELVAEALTGGVATTLATSVPSPISLAVNDDNLYWADAQAIMRLPLSGGTPLTLARTIAKRIAADATGVYWTTGSSLLRTDPTGGHIATLASTVTSYAIALDDRNVYWSELNPGKILRVSK